MVPPVLQVRLLNGAGLLAFSRGDHQQGRLWNQKALNIGRANDDSAGAAWALFWLSAHATDVPDTYEQGIEYCREALTLFKEINDEYGLAWGNNQIGELSRLLGNYEQARTAYLQSLAICRASGNIRREAIALVNLGYTAQHQGNYAEAETFMLEGLALLYHLKLEHHAAISLATLSGPATAQGAEQRAATLLGASDAAFARLAIPYQPADRMEIDQYVSQVRLQVGDEAFRAAWSVGQAMTFDEAVAYALLGSTRRDDSRAALESQA
jgi:tetratricopeptide (TPR) repeat protein